jgi:hypothetical protein
MISIIQQVRAQSDMTIPVPSLMHYVRTIAAQPGGPIMPFYEVRVKSFILLFSSMLSIEL